MKAIPPFETLTNIDPKSCNITEDSNHEQQQQQWLGERASLLRYKYIACLVSLATAVFWLSKLPTRRIPGVLAQQM